MSEKMAEYVVKQRKINVGNIAAAMKRAGAEIEGMLGLIPDYDK